MSFSRDVSAKQPAEQGLPNLPARAVSWRRDARILERLVEVERRHLAHLPNTRIAAELGIDEGTVRRDLKRLGELWRERITNQVLDLRARAVAELEDVKRRALETFDFDMQAERAVLLGDQVDGKPVLHDENGHVTFRGQKSAALNVARQAIMDQAKILGLIVDKVSPTDASGRTLDLATLIQKAKENRARREAEESSQPRP